jgi:hypothetical protein
MRRKGLDSMRRKAPCRCVAVLAGAAFFWALALNAWPTLHERIHPDAKGANHNCAVTYVASGSYEHSSTPAATVAGGTGEEFGIIPALTPHWVASPFLSASIFEHAPPHHA